MPMKVTATATAGELHPNPFVGPIDHVLDVRLDVSDLSSDEVDSLGYLKPGVLLTRGGELVEPNQTLLAIGTVVISAADATKFKTTTTAQYQIGSGQFTKAATDNLVFSAANTINVGTATGSFFGAWLIQINAAGTVSTKPAGGLTDQVYTSSALALAAIPEPDDLNVGLATVVIAANADSSWTANTDDMTPASDCVSATFADLDVGEASSADNKAFGAVVEAVKVATGNTSALLNAATDIDVTVATICMINRAILEDSLGRSLTVGELYNKPDCIVLAY